MGRTRHIQLPKYYRHGFNDAHESAKITYYVVPALASAPWSYLDRLSSDYPEPFQAKQSVKFSLLTSK